MIYLLTATVILLFVLVFLALWRTGLQGWYAWLLIPFVIFNLGFSWHTVTELQGWPFNSTPATEKQFLYATADADHIYILAQAAGQRPRLYAVANTPETAQQVQAARAASERGEVVFVKPGGPSSQDPLQFYQFDHVRAMPKE